MSQLGLRHCLSNLLSVLSDRFAVGNTVRKWFASFLGDQSQSFNHAGKQIAVFSVNCSVPLGSILGPLEFITKTEEVVRIIGSRDVEY
jgi:hypothetical protein